MTVIEGGRRNDVIGVGGDPVGDRSAATVGLALGAAPGTSEERVVDAMLDCVGRWGLTKTTVEDVARSAGLSRATVYRLFPGGKNAILMSALHTEIARLVAVLTDDLDREDDLEGCLARAISLAAGFLRDNLALEYLREHEWESVETFLAFDRLDTLFLATGALMGPVLERFLEPSRAADVAVWAARVVMSYLSTPAEYVDLADEAGARHLVSTYLMPGLVPADTPSTPSAGPVH